ncbi:LysR family transcriptional regulator [Pseudoduganella sp. OTU4001]|uniref:LysR family transcriptional regulator n=1 Tax=Pseudoduganella sp. OTU4001 TaxID=3043854 RepID=UPI00313B2663
MLELRLLQVFDEIIKGRSVSRAAENLGIGQPAVSVALSKLREHFGDPLFVRIGHVMEPTPLARDLAQPVVQALQALEKVYTHRVAFDPASSSRKFAICMSDISQLVLLPKLLAYVRRYAPGLHIEILPQLDETAKLLETGEADLAFGFMPQLEAGFYEQTLFRQRYVCIASASHPRVHDAVSLEQFQSERHAVVSFTSLAPLVLEREIARQNIRHQVALRVPSYLSIPLVVETTDLIVTVPELLVELFTGRARFRAFPVPFELPEFSIKQHWHERFHHDPGNMWLRQTIFELIR